MHLTHRRLIALAFVLALAVLTTIPRGAIGHDHRFADPYEFIIGWRAEPPFVGVLNGLDLGIRRNVTGGGQEWVEGVEGNLTATLMTGGSSVVKSLEAQFGQPGWYTFDVIPTREGTYSVRIQGTLGTTHVDVAQALETVTARGDVEFPVPDPTPTDLAGENAALRAQASLLLGVGVVGVVIGLISLGVAVRAMRKRPAGP